MTPKQFFTEVGQYQLTYTLDSPYANNYVREEWSMVSNLYASVDTETGLLTISRVGEQIDGSGPNANVTVTIYLSDGSSVSATSNINFWKREVVLGDIVYHDGTIADADDHETNVAAGKIAIGVCFYIDPNDKTKRLMVSLADTKSGGTYWGITSSNSPVNLIDHPDLNAYDIKQIKNFSANGFGVTAWSQMRDEMNGDKDGWKMFLPTQAGSELGWMTVTSDDAGYTKDEKVPYGKFYQACVIDTRNKVLEDSSLNLPIPTKSDALTETLHLTACIEEVKNAMGIKFTALYFPHISFCYAYQPTTKEGLKDEFKAHNWWLPTWGEMARCTYYYQEYKNPNNTEGVVNPLNIFKKAIDKGIMQPFKDAAHYYTITESASIGQCIGHVAYSNSYGNWYPASISKHQDNRPTRAICAF
jgi:hypothetical protein